jgi:ribonuclease HI
MSEEKIFAEGFSFKRRENAPEFVVGRQSIKVEEAVAFLEKHSKNGWVNIDIKQAKNGNYYCELDNWDGGGKKEEPKNETPKPSKGKTEENELPF